MVGLHTCVELGLVVVVGPHTCVELGLVVMVRPHTCVELGLVVVVGPHTCVELGLVVMVGPHTCVELGLVVVVGPAKAVEILVLVREERGEAAGLRAQPATLAVRRRRHVVPLEPEAVHSQHLLVVILSCTTRRLVSANTSVDSALQLQNGRVEHPTLVHPDRDCAFSPETPGPLFLFCPFTPHPP